MNGSLCVDPCCPVPIRVFNEIAHLVKHVVCAVHECLYCSFSCTTRGGLTRHHMMHQVCVVHHMMHQVCMVYNRATAIAFSSQIKKKKPR